MCAEAIPAAATTVERKREAVEGMVCRKGSRREGEKEIKTLQAREGEDAVAFEGVEVEVGHRRRSRDDEGVKEKRPSARPACELDRGGVD
jgi:hypothetical protein